MAETTTTKAIARGRIKENGKHFAPGDTVKLSKDRMQELLEMGVIELDNPTPEMETAEEPERIEPKAEASAPAPKAEEPKGK